MCRDDILGKICVIYSSIRSVLLNKSTVFILIFCPLLYFLSYMYVIQHCRSKLCLNYRFQKQTFQLQHHLQELH